MAELEGLYFGMGIDTSQLHSDFVDAERTINQNLARLNKEMKLIQLHGQIELEGLDESADAAEKLRIQEEALNAQMNLQQDKIVMLSAVYDHLNQTQGANAEATKKVEMQLAREQLAMQRLTSQMEDLNEQNRIAVGFNYEAMSLVEPAFKAIDAASNAGRILPVNVFPAKMAAVALSGVIAFATGTAEATDEVREENPAKILDEDFRQAAVSIDDSWQRISESNRRGFHEMRSYSNNGYRNYRNQQFSKAQAELETAKEEQKTILENFAKALGIGESDDGGLKIFPDANKNDILRVAKIFEDYRFSESLANAIDLFKESDSVIGKVAAGLASFVFFEQKVEMKFGELAESMITNFRELSSAATVLNLPLERTNDLLGKIALAGADYEDVRDYVRGVQDAVIKGDSEDPEVLALEKYGVVIQDAQGKLLDFDVTLDRLYQGYLKAREAGEAEGYVMMTNGQAVHDILPYFENLAKAEEDVAKIKWATMDPATLSNASHEMKLLEVQTNELQNALSGIAAPAAEMAFRNMFEDEKALTELIEENRETIIYWSYVFMEAIETLRNFKKELSVGAKDSFLEAFESIKSINEQFGLTDMLSNFFSDEPKKEIEEQAKEYFIPFYDELKKLEEEFGVISELGSFLPKGFTEELDNATKEYLVPFYETIKSIKEEFSIINKIKSKVSEFLPDDFFGEEEDSIFARARKDLEEYIKANEEFRIKEKENAEARKKLKEFYDGLGYSENRIKKYKEELENLKLDIEFGNGDSYLKQIGQNKIWYDQAMKNAKMYYKEQIAIDEVNAARLEKINLEKEEKLKEIRERIAAADKTELENRIADIEKEKESWIQAGMEKAEAEGLAQKQLSDYVTNAQKDLNTQLQALYQTELENRLEQIEKERQAWIDKCGDEVKATQKAEQEKADAQRNAAMNVIKQQAKEYEAYQKGGLAGLQAYKMADLKRSGVNLDYLNMTPQQLQQFQQANQLAEKGLMPNFMTETDKAMYREQWQQSYQQIQKEFDDENYAIVNGIKTSMSEVLGGIPITLKLDDDSVLNLSPNGQSATMRDYETDNNGRIKSITETNFELPSIVSEVAQSFSEMPSIVQVASDSLNELPVVIQGITENLSSMEMPQFADMNQPLEEVKVRLNDLSAVLESFSSQRQNQSAEQRTPVNVNVTVQIQEAHAWDSEHIQELSDRVADKIQPEIISAIGGDSNSY